MPRLRPLLVFLASTTLLLALAACSVTITPPIGPDGTVPETVPETTAGTVPETIPPAADLLPAPLYFLNSLGQVMRVERDGQTLTQLTNEPIPITDFDVSPTDGRLLYVSNNNLITVTTDGTRTVKITGDPLLDGDYVGQIVNAIRSPRFAPSGEAIAFAFNGINLAEVGPTPVYELLRPSDPHPDLTGELPSGPTRFYLSMEWSPDGERLLEEFAFYPEAGGLAIDTITSEPADKPLFLVSTDEDAPLVGDWAWSRDGLRGYIASNLQVYGVPGLAEVDAQTGFVTLLAPGLPLVDVPDAPLTFFRAPHERADGTVLVFVAAQGTPDEPLLYTPHELVDGELAALVDDSFALWGDVLWSDASDGAVITLGDEYVGTRPVGALVWVPMNEAPMDEAMEGEAVALSGIGSNLRWGPVDLALDEITLPDTDGATQAEAAITAQMAEEFDLTVGTDDGFDGVVARRLDGAAVGGGPFWVAHTTGFRPFDPLRSHLAAIYTEGDDGYALVDSLELDGLDADSPLGPDYLFKETVNQVALELGEPTSRLWLNVEGGAGAHSGTYQLLSFDGETLRTEVTGFSASPGAGQLVDLGNDATTEVALDATDYYVFCYACGVRELSYVVLRWDGEAFVPMELETLDDGAASEAVVSANNELVTLAEANLWRDALALLDDADGPPRENEVYAHNAELVRFLGEARRELTRSEPLDFTLLRKLFYGDYEAAVDELRPYEIADLLDPVPESPLFAGTVAEGFDETIAEYIIRYATDALAVQPDNAAAHYLLGWAQNLLDRTDPAALENIERATELAPGDDLYSKSLAFLQG